jgi:hypothetical protein
MKIGLTKVDVQLSLLLAETFFDRIYSLARVYEKERESPIIITL